MILKFIAASTLISLLPGPSMILVIMNTIKRGALVGLMTILGVVIADAMLLGATFSGLGASIQASEVIFNMVKWIGAFYLIYLGVSELLGSVSEGSLDMQSKHNALKQGIATTLLNPKIIIFLIAFFPPYINKEAALWPQIFTLGPAFLITVFMVLMLYLLCADNTRKLIESKRGKVCFKTITGMSLIGFGILAAGG